MQFALLGDIHSSMEDLEEVLEQISDEASEATIIGTGDIYECTVSKKKLHGQIYPVVGDVIKHPDSFEKLLTFSTIYGNQEERILLLTQNPEPLREYIEALPETMKVDKAIVIHGHQWPKGEGQAWLAERFAKARLVFHGHTHDSGLMQDGQSVPITWHVPQSVAGHATTVVNVGAVVKSREWVLYDSEEQTVTFMKA